MYQSGNILYRLVTDRAVEFAKSFEESGPSTPVFFILSPGVNPLKGRCTYNIHHALRGKGG